MKFKKAKMLKPWKGPAAVLVALVLGSFYVIVAWADGSWEGITITGVCLLVMVAEAVVLVWLPNNRDFGKANKIVVNELVDAWGELSGFYAKGYHDPFTFLCAVQKHCDWDVDGIIDNLNTSDVRRGFYDYVPAPENTDLEWVLERKNGWNGVGWPATIVNID